MTKTITMTILVATLFLSTALTVQNVFADIDDPTASVNFDGVETTFISPQVHTPANTIYDGGDLDGSDGYNLARWIEADNFTLEDDKILTDVHFWTLDRGARWDGTMEYFVYENNNGVPGALIQSGDGVSVIRTDLGPGPFGTTITSTEFDLDVALTLSAGDYWLGLHMQDDFAFADGPFWATSTTFNAGSHALLPDGIGNWGTIGHDLAFKLTGSDPIGLPDIFTELKEIWMAIQNEIIPLLTNIDETTTNTNNVVTNEQWGLQEIKREVRIIEEVVTSQTDKVSVTVNLDDKLKTGQVMVLLDTTGTGTLSTVHVAASLPCNITGDGKPTAGGDAPGVFVVVGEATGDLDNLIWDGSTDTGFEGSDDTCVYHASVNAVDVTGGVITDVIIVHPDNHPDADKKEIKKHEKLKGIVTVTGTYN